MQLGKWEKKINTVEIQKIHWCVSESKIWVSPCCRAGDDLQAAWVPDKLVQNADNLLKLGSVVSVFLPAVQHQLIQCSWAVHGGRQPIAFIHSFNHLCEKQFPGTSELRLLLFSVGRVHQCEYFKVKWKSSHFHLLNRMTAYQINKRLFLPRDVI